MATSFSRRDAKALLVRARSILKSLGEINSLEDRCSKELRQAVLAVRREKCLAMLRAIPLKKCGAREYETSNDDSPSAVSLADVVEHPSAVLVLSDGSSIPARQCYERVLEGMRLQIESVDAGESSLAPVLRIAYVDCHAKSLLEGWSSSDDAEKQLMQTTERLAPAAQLVRRLFMSQEQKAAFEDDYQSLLSLVESPFSEEVGELRGKLLGIEHAAQSEVRTWCRENPALVRVIVEKATPGSVGDDDWPFSSRQAQNLVDRTSDYLDKLSGIDEIPAQFVGSIKRSVDQYLMKKLIDSLKTVDVEELSKAKRGLRIKALRSAGYETVDQVYLAPQYAIENIKGISSSGAQDIKSVVREMANRLAGELKVRLNLDDRSQEQVELMCKTYALKRWIELRDEALRIRDDCSPVLQRLVTQLGPSLNPIGWIFSRSEDRDGAARAYSELSDVLAGALCGRAESLLGEMEGVLRSPVYPRDAARSFAEDPISFNNALEQVCPEAIGSTNDAYGLPEELAREIQDQCFFPEGLTCKLRGYQVWGVKYILHQEKTLLGDEMGLGKTVQAIAAMVSLRNTGETHFMVVCPASVLENWYREVKKHSKLRVVKVYGSARSSLFDAWKKEGGVAVTTYETVGKLDLPSIQRLGLLVVDEAHYIKNRSTARAENVLKVLERSNRVVLMTGTALENRVEEMLALIGYLRPDVARKASLLAFVSSAKAFRDAVASVYYRRKREDVLSELPDLEEIEAWCSLGHAEEEIYERDILSKNIMAARRVSWSAPDLSDSSKAQRLLGIVDAAMDEKRKVLVFSFFRKTLEAVASLLGDACVGEINGSVAPAKRQEIIQRFNGSESGSVLLGQIDAAGTGMNIQTASVIVLCEPQYKPSTENQAIARAYRMGQTRNVLVYRLLCSDTVDERFYNLVKEKQAFFNAFADKSTAAAAEQEISIDGSSVTKILNEEIERIKAKNPELAARVQKEQEASADRREMGGVQSGRRSEPPAESASALRKESNEGDSAIASSRRDAPYARTVSDSSQERHPRFCVNCGGEYPSNARFCPYCGARIEAREDDRAF